MTQNDEWLIFLVPKTGPLEHCAMLPAVRERLDFLGEEYDACPETQHLFNVCRSKSRKTQDEPRKSRTQSGYIIYIWKYHGKDLVCNAKVFVDLFPSQFKERLVAENSRLQHLLKQSKPPGRIDSQDPFPMMCNVSPYGTSEVPESRQSGNSCLTA